MTPLTHPTSHTRDYQGGDTKRGEGGLIKIKLRPVNRNIVQQHGSESYNHPPPTPLWFSCYHSSIPEPSVINIGSGKVSISILVSYVRLVNFQGSYATWDSRDLRIAFPCPCTFRAQQDLRMGFYCMCTAGRDETWYQSRHENTSMLCRTDK